MQLSLARVSVFIDIPNRNILTLILLRELIDDNHNFTSIYCFLKLDSTVYIYYFLLIFKTHSYCGCYVRGVFFCMDLPRISGERRNKQ